MDTPVESTDHALLRNRRVGRCARGISPLKATRLFEGFRWRGNNGSVKGSLGLPPEPRQQAVKAKLRHFSY